MATRNKGGRSLFPTTVASALPEKGLGGEDGRGQLSHWGCLLLPSGETLTGQKGTLTSMQGDEPESPLWFNLSTLITKENLLCYPLEFP